MQRKLSLCACGSSPFKVTIGGSTCYPPITLSGKSGACSELHTPNRLIEHADDSMRFPRGQSLVPI